LKRDVLGDYTHEYSVRDRNRRNKKKNALVVREKNAMRDDIYIGEDLKIYQ